MTFEFWIWFLAAFAATCVYASFFEWLLHKYIMHRPLLGFKYPFKAHAVVHHQIFRSDHTYHLHNESDKETIPMAWWNGPALVLLACLPFAGLAYMMGQSGIAIGSVVAMGSYYGLYERIHWCMHLPKARRVEKSWLFRRLNGHHLLHHRYMHKNFNVVLPLADMCLGTLLLRSKIKFAQALGPAVPDVQPRA
jgi:hypothetical protein